MQEGCRRDGEEVGERWGMGEGEVGEGWGEVGERYGGEVGEG